MSTETQTPPKFKSMGRSEKINTPLHIGATGPTDTNDGGNTNKDYTGYTGGNSTGATGGNATGATGATGGATGATGSGATGATGGGATGATGSGEPSSLTDDQLRAGYEQLTGEKFTGSIEDLKKLLKKEPPPETEEQKLAKAKAREKRIVDKFLANDGTIQQLTALQNLANMDTAELSLKELKEELKAANFKDSEIDDIIKERYYQIADEELEKYDDETEKDFLKRKKEYGAKLLANRSKALKDKAVGILSNLESEIDAEDLQAQQEAETSSKVEEHFKTLPRKLTFTLGEADDRQLNPIEYEVADADVAEVEAELKDPVKRKQILYNEDGSLNVSNIANMRLQNKILLSLLKTTYLSGETNQVEEFEKKFGSNPHEIGTGGNGQAAGGGKNNQQSGNKKPTGFGKPQVANVNLNKK